MTEHQLDPGTEKKVRMVIDQARRSGASIPRRLHEAGLLHTQQRRHKSEMEALEQLRLQFRTWLPHEFLRLVNRELAGCTPADMHHAISNWLEDYVAHIKKSL